MGTNQVNEIEQAEREKMEKDVIKRCLNEGLPKEYTLFAKAVSSLLTHESKLVEENEILSAG